jgi:hypothetical protein
MAAVFVFLDSNTAYLQELRERIRAESAALGASRERHSWIFLGGSVLLIPVSLFLIIIHAT